MLIMIGQRKMNLQFIGQEMIRPDFKWFHELVDLP